MTDRIDQFEADVMEKLLAGGDDVLAALRRQYHAVKRMRREYTGVGFFLYFEIPRKHFLPGKPSFVISGVWATIPGLESPVSLSLFIRDGQLSMLDGAACDDNWSASIGEYSLFYLDGPTRDLSKLRAMPDWPKNLESRS